MKVEKTIIDALESRRMVNWRELWMYKDLFWFLIWRDIKTRYAQSALGIGWAVIQPVFSMIVFSVIFGRLAQVDSEGVPYAIFSFTALVPWTYFSSSLTAATGSLISSRALLTKVYFPRLVIPVAPVLGRLLDFSIAFVILLLLMAYYQYPMTSAALYLPLLVILMIVTAAGSGIWLTALAIQYRDINYAMNFLVQLLMYAGPVVYPTSSVPENYRNLYALNPMVGVIEGFRSVLLGTIPMPWRYIAIGSLVSGLILITGTYYFRRMEIRFADVA